MKQNKFQLSFAGTHCKICIFETVNGRFFVFHGSANLRSSSNIEQICLEENKDLYLFYNEIQTSISDEFKTINKSLRSKQLWQLVEKVEEKAEKGQNPKQGKETQKLKTLTEKKCQKHHFKESKF